ncbi:MAG: hypothetical protein AB7F59_11720 [Bdellovibrionales bacterium]
MKSQLHLYLKKRVGPFIRTFFILLLCLDMGPPAEAQESSLSTASPIPAIQTSLPAQPTNRTTPSFFKLSGQIKNESQIQGSQGPQALSQLVLSLIPSLQWKEIRLSVASELTKEQQGKQKLSVSDTKVSLGHKPLTLSKGLTTQAKVSYIAATNEDSIKQDRLRAGASVEPSIRQELQLGVPVTLDYRLGFRQNFHEYNVNADGNANIQWVFSHVVGVTVGVMEDLEISIAGLWRTARTYKNFERLGFGLSEEISWGVSKNWNLFLGHSNEGSLQPAERQNSSLKAFDDKSSVIYGGFGWDF